MGKVAVIAGATGLIGKNCLDILAGHESYDEIRVLSRRSTGINSSKVKEVIIDFDRLEDYSEVFEGAADVFCCLGTTIKKAGSKEAFRQVDYGYVVTLAELSAKNCDRFLVVSAVGVSSQSQFFYNRVKGEMEKKLSSMPLSSLHIFKPSVLTGSRDEFRLGEKVGIVLMSAISPLLAGKLSKYKPIEGQKVALAMVAAAQTNHQGVERYEYRDMMKLIKER